jgi:hypothetical protein
MIACEPAKDQLSFARKPQDRPALVGGIHGSRQQAFALGPIGKLDCAVVLQPKSLGHIRNRHGRTLKNSSHLQEKLVLLWMQSSFQSRALTEVQKTAQFKAKFRQGSQQRVRTGRHISNSHIYIVTRYLLQRKFRYPSLSFTLVTGEPMRRGMQPHCPALVLTLERL